MTSRYALYDTAKLYDRFKLKDGLPKGVKPHYNVNPTMSMPVIINRDGVATAELMQWGLVAKGSKDTGSVFRYKTYNAPSEKIASRHSLETAVRQYRCLVPVNGYYELINSSDESHAYYIQLKGQDLFALAGIYSNWEDSEGKTHGTFSIITIETDLSRIPGTTRMPIVLSRANEERWLDTSVSDANALFDMIRTSPDELFKIYEVGPDIRSTKADTVNLIKPRSS